MNTELLLKVKAHILEEPLRLDMGDWIHSSDTAPCGTEACIAGWACILASPEEKIASAFNRADIQSSATRLLDITKNQSAALFFTDAWPESFAAYNEQNWGSPEAARIAAERIDAFILANGNDGPDPDDYEFDPHGDDEDDDA